MIQVHRIFATVFILSASIHAFETTADEVQFDTKRNICYLTGNVVAKLSGKTFMADNIVIYMQKFRKKPNKIIAKGNVTYSDGKVLVKAKRCESDITTVTFSENVVIEGKDYGTMKADWVVYQIKTGEVSITSKNRVKCILDARIEKKLKKKNR